MCIIIAEQQLNNTRADNSPSYRPGGTSDAPSVVAAFYSWNKGVSMREVVGPKVVWKNTNESEERQMAHTCGDSRNLNNASKVHRSDNKSVWKEVNIVSVNTAASSQLASSGWKLRHLLQIRLVGLLISQIHIFKVKIMVPC